jgi:hypothetical protein
VESYLAHQHGQVVVRHHLHHAQQSILT